MGSTQPRDKPDQDEADRTGPLEEGNPEAADQPRDAEGGAPAVEEDVGTEGAGTEPRTTVDEARRETTSPRDRTKPR